MDYSSEDIHNLIASIDRLSGRFTGGFGGSGNRDDREGLTTRQQFDKSVRSATQGLSLMHGSARDASYVLQSFSKGAIGATMVELVRGMTNMTHTYSKLTSVGQTFNGSMFEMQRQAAASELTLEQFADQISKSSVVVAQMSGDQTKGVAAFSKYQKGVRDSLSAMGFFGMSISQVNDASGEYAETLRQSGQWDKLDKDQRQQASADFITRIQQMAEATGKSREELLKTYNQGAREPITAAMTATLDEQQQTAFRSMGTMLSAFPELSKMMNEMIAKQGRWWDTSLGKAAQNVGKQDLIQPIIDMYNKRMAGMEPDLDELQAVQDIPDKITSAMHQLSPLASSGFEGDVAQIAQLGNHLKGFNAADMLNRIQNGKKPPDDTTLAMETFENEINKVTSALRDGFYNGILSTLLDKNSDDRMKHFNASLEGVLSVLKEFSRVLGGLLGSLLDLTPTIVFGMEFLGKTIGALHTALQKFLSFFVGEKAGRIGTALATVVAVGAALWKLKDMLGLSRRMNANVVNLYARHINGAGGFGTGGHSIEPGGGPGASPHGGVHPKAPVKQGWKGWFTRNFAGESKFARYGKGFVGMIGGLIAGQMVNSVLDHTNIDDATKQKIEDGIDVTSGVLGWFAPKLMQMVGSKLLSLVRPAAAGAEALAGGAEAVAGGAGVVAGGASLAAVLPVALAGAALTAGAVGAGYVAGKDAEKQAQAQKLGFEPRVDPETGMATSYYNKQTHQLLDIWEMQKMIQKSSAQQSDEAMQSFRQQVFGMIDTMTNLKYDPTQGINASNELQFLGKLTPEAMADAFTKAHDDTKRDALSQPIQDNVEQLNQRLLELTAMRSVDEQKAKQGDTSADLLKEICDTIQKQQEITNYLLHRGNNIAEDASRKQIRALSD